MLRTYPQYRIDKRWGNYADHSSRTFVGGLVSRGTGGSRGWRDCIDHSSSMLSLTIVSISKLESRVNGEVIQTRWPHCCFKRSIPSKLGNSGNGEIILTTHPECCLHLSCPSETGIKWYQLYSLHVQLHPWLAMSTYSNCLISSIVVLLYTVMLCHITAVIYDNSKNVLVRVLYDNIYIKITMRLLWPQNPPPPLTSYF